jgi:WD40 repeat protein
VVTRRSKCGMQPAGGCCWSLVATDGAVYSVAWSPDGKRLATGSGNIQESEAEVANVWDAASGRELLALPGHRLGIQRRVEPGRGAASNRE